MEKHFMLDIETTGIDPAKEDLLQIGILECDFTKEGYWQPGRSFELLQGSGRQPENEFAKKFMAPLYKRCNQAPYQIPADIRYQIKKFFNECGAIAPNVYLMGWNASNFDIPFLCHHGILKPNYYETSYDGKDIMRGDFHYRVYEIGGSVSLAQNVMQKQDRKLFLEEVQSLPQRFALPAQREQHDALFDCYKQLHLLNGLILAMRALG